MKPERRTLSIPCHNGSVMREVEAEVYGPWAVHATLWGPVEKPVKGKPTWRNWSVTRVADGVLVNWFQYQREAKAFVQQILEAA